MKKRLNSRKEQGRKEASKKEIGKKEILRKEPVKVAKKEKVDRFGQIKGFFKGVAAELKKVHWPTRREVIIYTIVVLVAVVFVGVLIWLFDIIFSQAFFYAR